MMEALSPARASKFIKAQLAIAIIVRTAGAYLGVAVLTIVFLVLTVPALRLQVSMLHDAILVALAPEGINPNLASLEFAGIKPLVKPVELDAVAARNLPRLPSATSAPESSEEVQRTEQIGLLGDLPVPAIESSMKQFGLTETQLKALEHYIARKYRVAKSVVDRIVESAVVVGAELKVNPVLILAVMSVESRFNPYAESGAGAQGLMQVMTRVHTDKFESLGQDQTAAFHPEYNIQVGAQILRDCIRRRGSVTNGLKCYVGASGPDDGGYSNKVLGEMRRMALAAKIKI
jgi:hypothetical protein